MRSPYARSLPRMRTPWRTICPTSGSPAVFRSMRSIGRPVHAASALMMFCFSMLFNARCAATAMSRSLSKRACPVATEPKTSANSTLGKSARQSLSCAARAGAMGDAARPGRAKLALVDSMEEWVVKKISSRQSGVLDGWMYSAAESACVCRIFKVGRALFRLTQMHG